MAHPSGFTDFLGQWCLQFTHKGLDEPCKDLCGDTRIPYGLDHEIKERKVCSFIRISSSF